MPEQETPDLVWIRATAEVNYAGIDPVEEYISYTRAEWDAMTEQEQERDLLSHAENALESVASSGASVVDPREVPDHIRKAGEEEQR